MEVISAGTGRKAGANHIRGISGLGPNSARVPAWDAKLDLHVVVMRICEVIHPVNEGGAGSRLSQIC
jgi:hypothetical protein